jgi:O-methyltransferase
MRIHDRLWLAEKCSLNSVSDLQCLFQLGVELDASGIRGDIVECGVCNGGSAAALALGARSEDRRFWLYDSFEGLPTPGPRDGGEAQRLIGGMAGDLGNVNALLDEVELDVSRRVVKKGWFADTFRQELPEAVALLHIDADWHDSVLLALETFYPLMEPGGVVVIDDFGYWEGARKAFFAFCSSEGIAPLVHRHGPSILYWYTGESYAAHTIDPSWGQPLQ